MSSPQKPARPSLLGRVRRRLNLGSTRRLTLEGRTQTDRAVERLDAHARTLRAQRDKHRDLTTQVADFKARLKQVERESRIRNAEHDRLSLQYGAIEHRLGSIEQQISAGTFVANDADAGEARQLVDAIRREHEQIRARLQIVSAYEERLRRVETTLTELYDGDLRHQV